MSRIEGPAVAIGIDVGGTELKAVLSNGFGLVGEPLRRRMSTPPGADGVVAELREVAGTLIGRAAEVDAKVEAVGIAIPGRVDPTTGRGEFSANLGWVDVSIGPELESALGLPVYVEHDVHAGALAEFTVGAGRGESSGAFVPIGTGMAAAIFIEGRFWRGANRFVGEIGHIRRQGNETPCGCGRRGCAELLASARGLEQAYARRAGSSSTIEAKEIASRASNGEQVAAMAWDDCVGCLAWSLAALTLTVDIDLIIIGGGLSGSGSLLIDALIASVGQELAPLRAAPEIRPAVLGQLAGARGAALYAVAAGRSVKLRESGHSAAKAPSLSRPTMFMVAFDHRSSTASEIFGQELVSPEQWQVLAEAKVVIAEAAGLARDTVDDLGEVSVLVDLECGMMAAQAARAEQIATALALEVSGQRRLELLDERTLEAKIGVVGAPKWGKVLLRWNSNDPVGLKEANLAALERARRFCGAVGAGLLLELIVPPTSFDLVAVEGDAERYRSEILPLRLPAAVEEITRRFGPPDLWKLQGVASPVAARAISDAACLDGSTPPILILGAGADRAEITRWFEAGAGVCGYAGFAIGRSIWKAPIVAYLDGRIDRDGAREAISSQFIGIADDYIVATRIAAAAGSR